MDTTLADMLRPEWWTVYHMLTAAFCVLVFITLVRSAWKD